MPLFLRLTRCAGPVGKACTLPVSKCRDIQLPVQQRLELAFEGFQEGQIDFPPTFKFDAGTDDYDTS